VLELNAEGVSLSEARLISDRLRADLFRTDKFIVLEREKVNDILTEQGFQQSGCTTNECAMEIGKLIGVQKIVAGYIGKLGNLFTMNVRFIDVEKGEVTRTATEDCNCPIEKILTNSVNNIALQLAGQEKEEPKNPHYKKTYTLDIKPLYFEIQAGLGSGDLGSDKMAIGCIISKDLFSLGRFGLNYLGVQKRIENFTIQYEYLYPYENLFIVIPKIGFGYISDKYKTKNSGGYYYWNPIQKKSESFGMLIGIAVEKYLSQSFYVKIGYDSYLSLKKYRKEAKNGALLLSIGYKLQ
jgi:hypothetical protein